MIAAISKNVVAFSLLLFAVVFAVVNGYFTNNLILLITCPFPIASWGSAARTIPCFCYRLAVVGFALVIVGFFAVGWLLLAVVVVVVVVVAAGLLLLLLLVGCCCCSCCCCCC